MDASAESGDAMTALTISRFAILGFYAGLVGLLFLLLSARVVRLRSQLKVDIGDGDRPELVQAIRAQANCAEYAPLVLLLMVPLAAAGSHPVVLHGLGAALLIGRVLHAQGLSGNPGYSVGRFWGISISWATLLVASLLCILLWFGIRI